jgi:hypothetical protein
MVVAGTGTDLSADAGGTFVVDTSGTLIPSISLTTAASPTLSRRTFCSITRISTSTNLFIGPWN